MLKGTPIYTPMTRNIGHHIQQNPTSSTSTMANPYHVQRPSPTAASAGASPHVSTPTPQGKQSLGEQFERLKRSQKQFENLQPRQAVQKPRSDSQLSSKSQMQGKMMEQKTLRKQWSDLSTFTQGNPTLPPRPIKQPDHLRPTTPPGMMKATGKLSATPRRSLSQRKQMTPRRQGVVEPFEESEQQRDFEKNLTMSPVRDGKNKRVVKWVPNT